MRGALVHEIGQCITLINLYPLLMFFVFFSICVFSIYVMFLLYVYTFTICSCHVVLKVYLLTYLKCEFELQVSRKYERR